MLTIKTNYDIIKRNQKSIAAGRKPGRENKMKKTVRTFSKDQIAATIAGIVAEIARQNESPIDKPITPRGNHKTGEIPAFNIPPVYTCGGHCRECAKHCYALKDYNSYRVNTVRTSHVRNLIKIVNSPEDWFNEMSKYFDSLSAPRFFRIHSSGDFNVNIAGREDKTKYARMWFEIAKAHPDTHFLAFTKCYEIVREIPFYTLPNFSLVLSEWTDVTTAPDDLKKIYPTSRAVNELSDARENEMICPGACENCGMCWKLKEIGRNVAFEIH